ncbi:replicative DNA helicase [Chitinivibrio alkaliphilus]|uniref:Replicative DNA helicase n=1 Tax=Chitinivibrio alkaliphilus ACht1 TaxID=1313304 RepID=U7DBI7_9BACT|nr:replicative DNA helicase [Chitinivibrio alkaliphilus]ERP38928.1 replicative DNA helicase [Chitinivibrio alkaliphilus ACht1]
MNSTAPSSSRESGGALRVPPHSSDMEKCVLASALIDESVLDTAMESLSEDDFYLREHRTIFSAMRTLANEEHTVDVALLAEKLRSLEKLDLVGGEVYLSQLVTTTATSTNIDKYIEILHQKKILRRLIHESTDIATGCFENDINARELLDQAEQKIFRISDENISNRPVLMGELLKDTFTKLEQISNNGGVTGLKTGFHDLDRFTTGLHPGELIIIAARPGMGKTAFVLSLASNIGIQGGERRPVALFSLEMPREQLMHRMLCSEASVEMNKLRGGFLSKKDFAALGNAAGKMYKAPVYIDDSGSLNPMELRSKCRRIKAQEKDLGVIIIDYLQLMKSTDKEESRQLEISSISRTLKEISKELKVPVIALSQLNRSVENRTGSNRPQLADLRESGAIEQDADLVLFLYREAYYLGKSPEGRASEEYQNLQNVAEVIIGKQRNGPLETVELSFIGKYTRFDNLDKTHHEEPEGF